MVRLLKQGSEIRSIGFGIRRQNLLHLLKEMKLENSEMFMSVPQNVQKTSSFCESVIEFLEIKHRPSQLRMFHYEIEKLAYSMFRPKWDILG